MNHTMKMPYDKPDFSSEELLPVFLLCQSTGIPGSLEDTYDELIF